MIPDELPMRSGRLWRRHGDELMRRSLATESLVLRPPPADPPRVVIPEFWNPYEIEIVEGEPPLPESEVGIWSDLDLRPVWARRSSGLFCLTDPVDLWRSMFSSLDWIQLSSVPAPEHSASAPGAQGQLLHWEGLPDTGGPDPDLVDTLVDLAKIGDELVFKELASMRGVPQGKLDEMWTETLRRVGRAKDPL